MGDIHEELDPKTRIELATKVLESDFEVINAIDSKFAIIVGFAMASVAEILGFLLLADVDNTTIASGGLWCLLVGLFFACLATFCGALGFWGKFAFARGASVGQLCSSQTTTTELLEVIKESVAFNDSKRQKKSRLLKACGVFALAAVIFFTISAFLVVRHINLRQITKQAVKQESFAAGEKGESPSQSTSAQRETTVVPKGAREH